MDGRRGSCLVLAVLAVLGLGACGLPGPRGGRAPWDAPKADVVALADDLGLTEAGRRLFLGAGPVLAPAERVEEACAPTPHGAAAINGCYVDGDAGAIVIRALPDPRLRDIELGTALWGLLMAGYDHLGTLERPAVDTLVQGVLDALPPDSAVRTDIATRAAEDPAAAAQQAFAIVGGRDTEPLPPDLEAVYARWLTDRAVTAAREDAVYASLAATSAELTLAWDAQVAQESAHAAARAQLESDRQGLDSNRATYTRLADDYNALSPEARATARITWDLGDGMSVDDQPTGDALAAIREHLMALPAQLDARAAELDRADAADATARSALEARTQDAAALAQLATPDGGPTTSGPTGEPSQSE